MKFFVKLSLLNLVGWSLSRPDCVISHCQVSWFPETIISVHKDLDTCKRKLCAFTSFQLRCITTTKAILSCLQTPLKLRPYQRTFQSPCLPLLFISTELANLIYIFKTFAAYALTTKPLWISYRSVIVFSKIPNLFPGVLGKFTTQILR